MLNLARDVLCEILLYCSGRAVSDQVRGGAVHLNSVLHSLDSISSTDKFVVVFVDKHLHVTIEALDLSDRHIAILQEMFKRFIPEQAVNVNVQSKLFAVNVQLIALLHWRCLPSLHLHCRLGFQQTHRVQRAAARRRAKCNTGVRRGAPRSRTVCCCCIRSRARPSCNNERLTGPARGLTLVVG